MTLPWLGEHVSKTPFNALWATAQPVQITHSPSNCCYRCLLQTSAEAQGERIATVSPHGNSIIIQYAKLSLNELVRHLQPWQEAQDECIEHNPKSITLLWCTTIQKFCTSVSLQTARQSLNLMILILWYSRIRYRLGSQIWSSFFEVMGSLS